jgi:NADPH-dependent 2,4-dienoyl-CoA reductase/sulfur reductase-like enzyme
MVCFSFFLSQEIHAYLLLLRFALLTSNLAMQRILVVGCGLAGLTVAIALRRAGHEVEIVEATEKIGYVGAGMCHLLQRALARNTRLTAL